MQIITFIFRFVQIKEKNKGASNTYSVIAVLQNMMLIASTSSDWMHKLKLVHIVISQANTKIYVLRDCSRS